MTDQQLLDDIAKQNLTIACLREKLAAMQTERGGMDKTLINILRELQKLTHLLTSIDGRTWWLLNRGGDHGREVLPESREENGGEGYQRRSSSSARRPGKRAHPGKQAQGRRRKG